MRGCPNDRLLAGSFGPVVATPVAHGDRAMTTTYEGVAYTADAFHRGERPGWAKVPEDSPSYRVGYRWMIRTTMGTRVTDGAIGSLKEGGHEVIEHSDGTITVSPSLVMPSGWHGWLRRGVFEVIEWGERRDVAQAAPLVSAIVGARRGIPNPICYATTPDRLHACSLTPGHDGPHNTRHDYSGEIWA